MSMTKIVLEFEGEQADFERAVFEKDEDFDLLDSVVWELDYGEDGSIHSTRYGDIKIKTERLAQ